MDKQHDNMSGAKDKKPRVRFRMGRGDGGRRLCERQRLSFRGWCVDDFVELRTLLEGKSSTEVLGMLRAKRGGGAVCLEAWRGDIWRVVMSLKRGGMVIDGVAKVLKCEVGEAEAVMDEVLRSGLWRVQLIDGKYEFVPSKKVEYGEVSVGDVAGSVRFGLVSDTHLCHEQSALSELKEMYDIFDSEGITSVLHCGNLLEGYKEHINKGEVCETTMEGQIGFLLDHYPYYGDIKTHFISTDCHSGWWEKSVGVDVGKYIQLRADDVGRCDLRHVGKCIGDVVFGVVGGKEFRVRLMHPKGGSAMGDTTRLQRDGLYQLVNAQRLEKPDLICVGHFHKHGLTFEGDLPVMNAGSFKYPDLFMEGKSLKSFVGGFIMEAEVDEDGKLLSLTHKTYPFSRKKGG